MRLAAPLGALLVLLIGPLMLAEAGGWAGQRSFAEELGSTLGISALGVLAIVLILPTRLRVFARLGADAAVRLHRHLVGVLLAFGHAFELGQFAWLRLSDEGTRFAEHPFSYTSSSEDRSRISFTIRAYQGFSARVGGLAVGTRFQVDGPHGGFRFRARAKGVLLLAYGIGITPSMSILRTAADRGDPRAFVLFYANRTLEDATFAEELGDLRERLDLRIVHVLSQPPSDWTGERGRITTDLLQRHAPDDVSRWDFFLCGAPAPVDAGITALSEIGIPPEQVHAERFVEV